MYMYNKSVVYIPGMLGFVLFVSHIDAPSSVFGCETDCWKAGWLGFDGETDSVGGDLQNQFTES